MNVLIVVSRGDTHAYVCGLAQACLRKDVTFSAFFTGEGVDLLNNNEVIDCLTRASEAVACEHAWVEKMKDASCPVSAGSQTDHSRMLASADRVVSL